MLPAALARSTTPGGYRAQRSYPGPVTEGRTALLERPRALLGVLGRELVKFGAVGAVCFVIDVGLFNLLRFGDAGPLADRPVTAKVVSASVATLVAWAGNRWWTFRRRRHPAVLRELVLFFAMNGVALVIAVMCLVVSHYVLGLRSPVADNVAANVVGVVLGTAFRFVAYRLWVFRGAEEHGEAAPGSELAAAAAGGPVVAEVTADVAEASARTSR